GTSLPLRDTTIRTIGRLNPCGSLVYGSNMVAGEGDHLSRHKGHSRAGEALRMRLCERQFGCLARADDALVIVGERYPKSFVFLVQLCPVDEFHRASIP